MQLLCSHTKPNAIVKRAQHSIFIWQRDRLVGCSPATMARGCMFFWGHQFYSHRGHICIKRPYQTTHFHARTHCCCWRISLAQFFYRFTRVAHNEWISFGSFPAAVGFDMLNASTLFISFFCSKHSTHKSHRDRFERTITHIYA